MKKIVKVLLSFVIMINTIFCVAFAADDYSNYEGIWTATPNVSMFEDHRGLNIRRADNFTMDFSFFWYQFEVEIVNAQIDGNTVYGSYYEVLDDGVDWDNYIMSGNVTLALGDGEIDVFWEGYENGLYSSKNLKVYNPYFDPVSDGKITVYLDGNEIYFPDQQPIIMDGRTLVPVRGLVESINGIVNWDGESQTATLHFTDHIITIRINDVYMDVDTFSNGYSSRRVKLDVPAMLVGDRTMIPLRAVTEALGMSVYWENNMVNIYS